MVKLRSYFLKCNSIKSMRIGLRCTLAMSSSCFGSNIKTTNGKSREQWGHEVCSSNMYPMLSDIENWCVSVIIFQKSTMYTNFIFPFQQSCFWK